MNTQRLRCDPCQAHRPTFKLRQRTHTRQDRRVSSIAAERAVTYSSGHIALASLMIKLEGAKLTVEACALLHDVADWKYSGCDKAGVATVEAFLRDQAVEEQLIERVTFVIQHIGFKESLKSARRPSSGDADTDAILAVVQDADRLEAIGAVGIARCLTFGGNFKRVLHDPDVKPRVGMSKEEYMSSSQQQTTINHFYEKLLLLADKMNTAKGRALGQERTVYMQTFLQQFYDEWDGAK